MDVQLVSDVHSEWHDDKGIRWATELPLVGRVLVLAGDISIYSNMTKVLSILCSRAQNQGVDVIYVCGNHEYYGTSRGKIHNKLMKLQNRFACFHWLNNEVIEIEGQRFLGTTLWWQCAEKNRMMSHQFRYHWLDARSITGYSNWILEAAQKARDFLWTNTRQGDVIVTHHAPSASLWGRARRHGEIWKDGNYFWYASMDDLILEKEPGLWLYGHTHSPVDTVIGETRVVHCPHGYVHNGPADPSIYQIINL